MKYHFIYPDIGTGYYIGMHHGIAHLVAVLKANEQEASLHYVSKEPRREDIVSRVKRESPDVVGFTTMSNQVEYVKLWSEWIKEECDVPVVCGGVHATLNPKEMLGMDGVDAVCIGEGERAISKGLAGYWHKRNGNIWMCDGIPLVESLDELPFPDYNLFDCEGILRARNGNFAVIASRGCPYNCSYCSNHALREAQKGLGKYFRYRSVDNTLEMLGHYAGMYPVRSFSFADDIFGLSRKWVMEFCGKYPKAIGLPFDCNLRVESATKEVLEALKSANCAMVEFGVESGNEWMRREVLNRRMTNQQIIGAFETAHKLGLKTRSYNMIGLPYETPEMARETMELNKRVKPDDVAVFYFYPYRGTKLDDVCKREGYLTEKKSAGYVNESVLNLPTITKRELKRIHDEFYRYALERKSQSYGAVIRFGIKLAGKLLRGLTWGHEIGLLSAVYVRLFPLFQKLRRA